MVTRIVLLHATLVAVQPIQDAFAELWPDAEVVNLLDDSLSMERAREGTAISDGLSDRFVEFGTYSRGIGADGILVTCSAFGPAIDRLAAAVPFPVLKPNEAMFEAAIASGRTIGMLATFAPAVAPMTDEFVEYARRIGSSATLRTIVVDGAIDLLRKGDATAHNDLVSASAPDLSDCDAIMLAQFSTSRAAEAVRANTTVPVITAPHAAVEKMRRLVRSAATAQNTGA